MTDKLREALEEILSIEVMSPEGGHDAIAETHRIARAALAAPSAEPVSRCPACFDSEFVGFKRGMRCSQCNGSGLATPARAPAAQHTAQSRLSDELSDLYSMGFSDGSKQADDPETNEQRRAAAINLVLGRLTAAATSVEAEPLTPEQIYNGMMENKCTIDSGEFPDIAFHKGVRFAEHEHNIASVAQERAKWCNKCGETTVPPLCRGKTSSCHSDDERPVLQGELHLLRQCIDQMSAAQYVAEFSR